MSGLAKLLAQAGHAVSGSDLKPSRALTTLAGLGVETWVGHRPSRAGGWDLVVASSAVPARDPELAAARAAGVEVWLRPRLLEAMTRRTPAIGVAGTHGKTTGTALVVAALRSLGRDPSFMVGGELVDLNTNAHRGEPGLFVLEADEAFGTFLEVHLAALAVTNVEADHLDHYGTAEAVEEAFVAVAARCRGPVVACLDDPGARRLAGRVPGVVGFGFDPESSWRITEVAAAPAAVSFTLQHGRTAVAVNVPRPGLHVARNAAGALAMLGELGFDVAGAAAGLASFGGVRRRFEVRARIRDITVVDDYAHHPTEVAATIAAARMGAPRRLVAVFQPHRFTRTAEHAGRFGVALAGADRVVLTDVYAAGEAPVPGVTGRLVADAAGAAGAAVTYVPRRSDLAGVVAREARAGDLVLLMGAGDITLVAEELTGMLGSSR
ncbi:MAG: UDP-N-acetylmuramate--L-alanine ligase [Acidimicrobiia bacterium]|nr:UDP-N-acetylmuramate--L-alanine ligase [Acidimicrobiia bacterium]